MGTTVVAMRWTANAAAIVTCGDTFFNVFSVSPNPSFQLSLLKKVSIQQMGNYSLAVSPDSRFVTVGTGVSMGLSVFELQYRQAGVLQGALLLLLLLLLRVCAPASIQS